MELSSRVASPYTRTRNRRYAHSITRTKNDQLSVDGAKLDGNLKAEVPYKSMGSKCGSSNNSPLELRTGHLACHTLLSVRIARTISSLNAHKLV